MAPPFERDTLTFNKGDIVRVEFASPAALDLWMKDIIAYGPGDVGVVRYARLYGVPNPEVSVMFPMLGVWAVRACNLQLVQRAAEVGDAGG